MLPASSLCKTTAEAGFVRHGVPSVKGDFRHLSAEELLEFREIFSLVDRVSVVPAWRLAQQRVVVFQER
jgi:hypothetical protein